jgi:hypothetical protein
MLETGMLETSEGLSPYGLGLDETVELRKDEEFRSPVAPDMGVKVFEGGILTEKKDLVVNKSILDSVKLLHTESSMTLQVLATKCWMKPSVPMGSGGWSN